MKLNVAERKVLTLLESDARMPLSHIAKIVRLSPAGVSKIIDRLTQEGVIARFNTKINYSLLGYTNIPVHIKLTKKDSTALGELKQHMRSSPSLAWFAFTEGEYDLLLSFKIRGAKSRTEMDELLRHLMPFTSERSMSLVLEAFEISRTFLDSSQERKIFPVTEHAKSALDIDNVDRLLLDLLRENARFKAVSLAQNLGVSAQTVASRISSLQKQGVISGFKTKLHISALGYHPYVILVQLSAAEISSLKSFMSYCRVRPGISYFVRQMGEYDLELNVDARTIEELYEIMGEIREKFEFVKKMTALVVQEFIS